MEFLRNEKFFTPSPDLPNQKLWAWDSAICVLTSPEGDSDAFYNSKTTGLKVREIFINDSRNPAPKEKTRHG